MKTIRGLGLATRMPLSILLTLLMFGVTGAPVMRASAEGEPILTVEAIQGWVDGYNWPLGVIVTLTVDDDNDLTNGYLYQDSLDSDPETGWVSFTVEQDNPGIDLVPGQYLTMTDGIITKAHQIYDVSFDSVDEANDTAEGRGPASRPAVVFLQTDIDEQYLNITIGPDGNWSADFGSYLDIQNVQVANVQAFDPDGDGSMAHLPPPPTVQVRPLQHRVEILDWPLDSAVEMTIKDVYLHVIFGPIESNNGILLWDKSRTYMYFDLAQAGIKLQPGDSVTVTDGMRSQIIGISNATASVSASLNQVSGASFYGAEIWVDASYGVQSATRHIYPEGTGTWLADFSQPGDEDFEQDTFDILPGTEGEARLVDYSGNSMIVEWYVGSGFTDPAYLKIPVSAIPASDILADTPEAVNLLAQLTEPLFLQYSDGSVRPAAATGYSVSEDKLTYTVDLRPSVLKWSDGQTVIAQQFVDGLLYLLAPQNDFKSAHVFYAISGAEAYHTGQNTDPASVGVRAVNLSTLQFTLRAPTPYFPSILAFPNFVPRRVSANFIGNGPYKVALRTDVELRLEPNPYYRASEQITYPKVAFLWIPGEAQRLAAYQRGEVDLLLENSLLRLMLNDPSISSQIFHTDPVGVNFLFIFTTRSATENPLVRKALASAIDRRAILDEILGTTWQDTAQGVIAPPIPGYQGTDVGYPYDPTAARAYLSSAGYPGGVGFPELKLLARPESRPVYEEIARGWRTALNITVKVVYVTEDLPLVLESCPSFPAACDPNASPYTWHNDFPDAYNVLNDLFNRRPASMPWWDWDNSAYGPLVEQARTSQDPGQRISYLQAAETLLVETDAAVIPINFMEDGGLAKTGILRDQGLITLYLVRWGNSDIDGDGRHDLIDPCPADPADACDVSGSGAGVIGAGGGTVKSMDGRKRISFPLNAVSNRTTFSITDHGSGYLVNTNQGEMEVFGSAWFKPDGTTFVVPVTVSFDWSDANSDGFVDGYGYSETNVKLSKDGSIIASCSSGTACDLAANRISVQVSSLSLFELGAIVTNHPPDAVPATFCVSDAAPNGTQVGTISFTDVDAGQAHVCSILSGNTNNIFAIPAGTCNITVNNSGALAAATYSSINLVVRVTDSGTPVRQDQAVITIHVDPTPPFVQSIQRLGPSPTNASSVQFTVTFSEAVTDVDAGDFSLAADGPGGASVTGVDGSGATRTVTVFTGTGDGTLRLDVVDNDSIVDAHTIPLGGAGAGNGSFTNGELYTMDKTPPQTTITGNPPNPRFSADVIFEFSSTEPLSTFECRLDGGDYFTCVSPRQYLGLSDGLHTFYVRATDPLGNTDGTPAEYTWRIDTTPPEVTLSGTTGSLPEDTNTSSAIKVADIVITDVWSSGNLLSLSGADAGLFDVSGVDLWLKAGSVLDYETNPILQVAVEVDDSNIGASPDDSASLEIAITDIDEIPPVVVSILRLGANPTNALSVQFAVTFSEPVTGVDSGDFHLTSVGPSGASITGVDGSGALRTVTVSTGTGDGTLRLDAADDDSIRDLVNLPLGGAGPGNGGYTRGESYTIDKTPPETTITSGPPNLVINPEAVFEFSSTELLSTFECSLDAGDYFACTSPKHYYGLTEGDHIFYVRATDRVGNKDSTPGIYPWTILPIPPNQPPVLDLSVVVISLPENTNTGAALKVAGIVVTDDGMGSNLLNLSGADAGLFEISGTDLRLKAGSALDYETNPILQVTVEVDDPNIGSSPDDSASLAIAITDIDEIPPAVVSVLRAGASPTNAGSVQFTVTFSEPVMGVDPDDFILTTSGLSVTTVTGVTGSGAVYSVNVNTGTGSGTLRLDVLNDGTMQDTAHISLAAGYSLGEVFTIDRTPPDTTISSGPAPWSSNAEATFEFTSTEPSGSFECRLDAGVYSVCASPKDYTGLVDGPHSFEVRAVDAVGNQDGTPASATWTVDTTAPETVLNLANVPEGSPEASFEFSSNEGGASFACRLDGAGYSSCASPKTYADLVDGPHTFDVYATDEAGNSDASPESFSWVVVVPPRVLSITRAGTDPTNAASLDFVVTFSEDVAGVDLVSPYSDFALTVSGVSSASVAGVSGGASIYTVNINTGTGSGTIRLDVLNDGTILDSASNPLAAGYSLGEVYTIDRTPPDTTITGGPAASSNHAEAAFEFTSTEPSGSFECRLDAGVYTVCTSPEEYTGLVDGPHSFEVRAVDAVGNQDGTPASATWTVDTAAPETMLTAANVLPDSPAASFEFSSEPGATFACRLDAGVYSVCISPKTYNNLLDGPHTFDVYAMDEAGNSDASPESFSWVVAVPPRVLSITRAEANPSSSVSVDFTVTFSEPVQGVDTGDFIPVKTGVVGTSMKSVTGSGSVYLVTVNTGTGNGTIRLDVVDDDSILDLSGLPLAGSGTGNGAFTGVAYKIVKTLIFTSVGAQDGWILESTETSGAGGMMNFTAVTFNLGDQALNKQYRSILAFNTANLPDNAVITKTVLKIRRQGLTGTNPFNTHQALVIDLRKGSFGTTALQLSDFNAQATMNIAGTVNKTPLTNNWYQSILKAVALPRINRAGFTQVRLRFALDDNNDLSADYLAFFTGNSILANRPQLIVTFHTP